MRGVVLHIEFYTNTIEEAIDAVEEALKPWAFGPIEVYGEFFSQEDEDEEG